MNKPQFRNRPPFPKTKDEVVIIDDVQEEVQDEINMVLSEEDTISTDNTINEVILIDDVIEEETKPIVVDSSPQPPQKMVWIKMKVDHGCIIGGVRFDLRKGKKYRVSASVRTILASSPLGLLDPVID